MNNNQIAYLLNTVLSSVRTIEHHQDNEQDIDITLVYCELDKIKEYVITAKTLLYEQSTINKIQ